MTTWSRLQQNARTPFKPGEIIRMEDGKRLKAFPKRPTKVTIAKIRVPRGG